MPVIEQKTTNKNKVDFDLNRLDKSKTTIFSKYPFFSKRGCIFQNNAYNTKHTIHLIYSIREEVLIYEH